MNMIILLGGFKGLLRTPIQGRLVLATVVVRNPSPDNVLVCFLQYSDTQKIDSVNGALQIIWKSQIQFKV